MTLSGILSEDGTRALAWYANDSMRRLDRIGYQERDFMRFPLGSKGTTVYAALDSFNTKF